MALQLAGTTLPIEEREVMASRIQAILHRPEDFPNRLWAPTRDGKVCFLTWLKRYRLAGNVDADDVESRNSFGLTDHGTSADIANEHHSVPDEESGCAELTYLKDLCNKMQGSESCNLICEGANEQRYACAQTQFLRILLALPPQTSMK